MNAETYDKVGLGSIRFSFDHLLDEIRVCSQRACETDEVDRSLGESVVHSRLGSESTSDTKFGVLESRANVVGKL